MIQIKTLLHYGIYHSQGGGETTVKYEWKKGPRNLIKAVECLGRHSARMTECYGNVGHVRSWIEIDGIEIDKYDMSALMEDDKDRYGNDAPDRLIKSRTEKARIVLSGKILL